MSKHPFPLRKLVSELREYGIVPLSKRGKGSEIILLKPESPGSKKGPMFPVKNHGPSTEISIPVVDAILRRFGIDAKNFWGV
jgi:hypothetical protein